MDISFAGPYKLAEIGLAPEASQTGIYLFGLPVKGDLFAYWVGETGLNRRTFRDRLKDHLNNFINAAYPIYSPEALARGAVELLCQGKWGPKIGKKADSPETCLKNKARLSKEIHRTLEIMQVFLAPIKKTGDDEKDRVLRLRIEAAILGELKGRGANLFQLHGINCSKRREDDRCTISFPVPLVGMPEWLWW